MSEYKELTPKLHMTNYGPHHQLYWFYCPGCDGMHGIHVGEFEQIGHKKKGWVFNGDIDSPTFTPSLLHPDKPIICHLNITDGKIIFHNDCGHKLAGCTVNMVNIEE